MEITVAGATKVSLLLSKKLIMKHLLSKAIAIAAKGFEGKLDKSGEPYIMHCIRVMNAVHSTEEKILGILHDCVEDHVITLHELEEMGFPHDIIRDLDRLTHDKKLNTYEDYIKKISWSSRAVSVKRADLKDNTDITRLKGLTKKDFDRLEKYHKAWVYLSSIK